MEKKQIIPIIILTLLFAAVLWIVWTKKPEVIVKVETKENIEKIDSLKKLISQDSILIDSLKNRKAQVIEKVKIEIEKLKTCPPDSAILVFGENLEKYGELRSTTPDLREDSIVLCSVDNIRNANIIAQKLEGEYEENKLLTSMYNLQSGIIVKKDSVIEQQSIILKKTEIAYQESIDQLKGDLQKEKRRRKAWTVGNGILGAALIGILIVNNMIDVVIGFDRDSGMYKVYEPTSDTLLVTTSLTDSFLKLSEFLNQSGMISGDILGSNDIRYHIDSATFLAMIESNVALLKRLNQAPSGFTIASQKFGQSGNLGKPKTGGTGKQGKPKFKSGTFSKSSFNNSYKKFGGYDN